MDENKQKALKAALGQIERQFGKGAVMRLGDPDVVRDVQVIPTGSLGLDIALGVGGLPRGRVVEIYGPESSGKTTLTLSVIAAAQRAGGTAAFIDAEHALDPSYAERLGVNVDDLLVSQPDTGEQALEIADMLVRSAAVDVVVVDSVAALTPKAEIERRNKEKDKPLPKLAIELPSGASEIEQTKARIEFKLASGQASSAVEAWRKKFAADGWQEEAAVLDKMAGSITFTKEGQALSVTYIDPTIVPAEITLQATGIELTHEAQ